MGYYTDAVNNISGGLNALGSAVTTAVIAGEHLKNQEKANETSYINTKTDLQNQTETAAKDLEKQNKGVETLEEEQDMYRNEEREILESAEDSAPGLLDQKIMDDWLANNQIQHELEVKLAAQRETRNQSQAIYDALKNKDLQLDKSNPKLAIKYGYRTKADLKKKENK